MSSIFDLRPHEKVHALLEGAEMRSFVPENNRVWWSLTFYASDKSRKTAAKKRRRLSHDAIFVEWDFTLEDIIKQGELLIIQASDKVLLKDKLDIFHQLNRR